MTKLEAAGWRIRQLFPGVLSGRRTDRDVAPEAGSAVVRLLDSPRRTPQTPIQQALVAVLNPDCAVKDFWSKERGKKDNRSSGLG